MARCTRRDREALEVTLPLVVEPEAAAEIEEAVRWYEARVPGLGVEFVNVLRTTLEQVERAPLQFRDVGRGIRVAVLRRFPYAAYFVVDTDIVSVLAVFHHRRDPVRWQSRR